MKKNILFPLGLCLLSMAVHSQLMVSKLIGNGSSKFGLGYGIFTYLDIPRASENQSFRIELMELAIYPTKGENFFTSTAEGRGYISIKLGYKYVFSETHAGFYIIPSAGYCRTVFTYPGQTTLKGDGIAGALESGYALEVGQNGHTLNFGLKYEYDHGGSSLILQSIGFRFSYAFGLFQRRDN
jgi:hypothetical protein